MTTTAVRGLIAISISLSTLACSNNGQSGSQTFDPIAPGCPTKYDCSAGQTCWSPLAKADGFVCAASGPIDAGQPCPTTTAMVVCGDRLGCFGGYDQTGRCVYFCDDSNPCPPGTGTCTQFNTDNGYSLKMCL